MEPTQGPATGIHRGRDEEAGLPLDRDQSLPINTITLGVGAARMPAEAGILKGAEETQADPEPIADPLQAAAEIDREEAKRGEVRPVAVTPEPGDVPPRSSE